MTELFKRCLDLSTRLRPQYQVSLGIAKDNWKCVFSQFTRDIPPIFEAIYNNVSGTRRDVATQELMDFIPGYRLIHIDEISDIKKDIERILVELDIKYADAVIPILADYSGSFICYVKLKSGKERIYSFSQDEGGFVLMHDSGEAFLKTIVAFYQEHVYFLDDVGYLDYDMEKEGVVGAMLNNGIEYWNE